MGEENRIPKEEGLDNSLKILKDGYRFILNRQHRFQSNVLETRLLGEKAICLTGKETAKLFYDNDKFKRSGAAPKKAQKTLFGVGGVQGLDGEAHHHRKALFMSLMDKKDLQQIVDLTRKQWESSSVKWQSEKSVELYEESKKILTQVACDWTGVPLKKSEVDKRAEQLGDLFESAASLGIKHLKGRKSRVAAEKWLEDLVEKVREDEISLPEDRALYTFSWHKDHEGKLLDKSVVAVELLNLLRPIVAISVYICFSALAVHQFPEESNKLKTGEDERLQRFVQEVRRYYPFFPFTVARVKEDFNWEGYTFEKDTLTLLDLYGTNHHPDFWENPDRFEPDRFKTWDGSPFDFIPQGGGEFDIGHRCAGEWITIDIMKVSLDYLVNSISYDLPKQDLSFSMTEMPSLPESRIIMENIRLNA
ncbi:cytochrome P450 [Sutcliffiella deserti]|uniref:cytochrome P450 n=1 Tax=Sutcliffiella deserti TaxID=2875501 RepID=UPI001CBBA118|nr:cytochrome P450 [Sutcliffiella deserti]